jgi:ketosteroid isomerase-like protein
MKRILCTVILVCVLATVATGLEGEKNPTPVARASEAAEVPKALKGRIHEYSEALTKHDLAALDKIWAEGYTFTNGRGQFLTKKERMENIKTGATQFDSISREEEEIRVFGDTAVVTGRIVLKALYSGKESSGPYRFINVWAKLKGHWQIVANQITPVAQ